MLTAAILFAIAAVGGAVMAAMRLKGRDRPPLAIALVHGVVAAAALITLIVAVKAQATPLALGALAGFVIAALGGATMFLLFHLKGKALPVQLMLVHAGVAVISFVVLLAELFKS